MNRLHTHANGYKLQCIDKRLSVADNRSHATLIRLFLSIDSSRILQQRKKKQILVTAITVDLYEFFTR